MKQITVNMGAVEVSNDPESFLVTYALGSCIAVMVHDPVCKVGGMIHYMLPLSKTSPAKASLKPAMFADTGIPLLFNEVLDYGCQKKNLVVKAAGGSKLYDDHGMFDIGKRNYTILRKFMWQNNLLICAEDIGGAKSRTVRFHVGTGKVTVSGNGQEWEL